jgi:hypothetical protein
MGSAKLWSVKQRLKVRRRAGQLVNQRLSANFVALTCQKYRNS